MPTGRLRSIPNPNHVHHHDLILSRHVMAQPQQPGRQTHHHLEDAASQAGVQVGRHGCSPRTASTRRHDLFTPSLSHDLLVIDTI